MIAINELRIGNLVNDEDGQPMYVGGIIPVGEQYKVVDSAGNICSVEQISGTPLDEEWLIKMGFYQLPHYTVGNNYLKDFGLQSQISISCINSCNLMVWLSSINNNKTPTDLVCLWNWDLSGNIHVHQIQNLYYALTKTELTINK